MKSFTVILFFVSNVWLTNAKEYKMNMMNLTQESSPGHRIIGGQHSTIEQWNFAVQVLDFYSVICGGSLVTQRHVLTAAHCVVIGNVILPANRFSILAGSTTHGIISTEEGQLIPVIDLLVHEQYNVPSGLNNDIALMLLERDATLSETVGLANIPLPGSVVPDDTPLTYVGWGTTSTAVTIIPNVLQEVGVYKVNWDLCEQRYFELSLTKPPWWDYFVTDTMMCAGVIDVGGRDACQGDSGGPLIYGSRAVVGVVSWGEGCAEALYPGVTARVANFTNWIEDAVEKLAVEEETITTAVPEITTTSQPTSSETTTEATPGHGVSLDTSAIIIFTSLLFLSLH